ncbi:MAG: hypothetical protein ACP5M9_01305 [Candidatus Micrarchaeia archaeon]
MTSKKSSLRVDSEQKLSSQLLPKSFYDEHKNKTNEELNLSIKAIARIFKKDDKEIIAAVTSLPQFINRNHLKIITSVAEIYSCKEEEAKKIILSHPQFSGYYHINKVEKIQKLYGIDKNVLRKIILSLPQFIGYDHESALANISEIYNLNLEDAKRLVLKNPQFLKRDHKKIIKNITDVYSCTDEEAKKAIKKFPQFAGYNHAKKIRRISRVARLIGIDEKVVKEFIIKNPVLASYSEKRHIAALDSLNLFKPIKTKDFDPITIIKRYSYHISKSPYVPNTKLRVSKAKKKGHDIELTPFLKEIRKITD